MTPQDQFRELAKCAGAKDLPRVLASGRFAVSNGDDPQYVLDRLLHNQPALFNKAANRQRDSYDSVLSTPDGPRRIKDDLRAKKGRETHGGYRTPRGAKARADRT